MRVDSPRTDCQQVFLSIYYRHPDWDHWVEFRYSRLAKRIEIDVRREHNEKQMFIEDAGKQLKKAIAKEKIKDEENKYRFEYKLVKSTIVTVKENYEEENLQS
jgi:hypothetical protein